MISRILCRLGLHSWKPRYLPPRKLKDGCLAYAVIGGQCRRCGKRVRL